MTQQNPLLPANTDPAPQTLPTVVEDLDSTDLQRIGQLLDGSAPENTPASYRFGGKTFTQWAGSGAALAMPASPTLVAAYLSHLAEEHRLSVATAQLHRAAIHKPNGHPDLT